MGETSSVAADESGLCPACGKTLVASRSGIEFYARCPGDPAVGAGAYGFGCQGVDAFGETAQAAKAAAIRQWFELYGQPDPP